MTKKKQYTHIRVIKSRVEILEMAKDNAKIYCSGWGEDSKVVSAKFVNWMNKDTVEELIKRGELILVIESKIIIDRGESVHIISTYPSDESKEVYNKSLRSKATPEGTVRHESPLRGKSLEEVSEERKDNFTGGVSAKDAGDAMKYAMDSTIIKVNEDMYNLEKLEVIVDGEKVIKSDPRMIPEDFQESTNKKLRRESRAPKKEPVWSFKAWVMGWFS